jgi:hypothetical protein
MYPFLHGWHSECILTQHDEQLTVAGEETRMRIQFSDRTAMLRLLGSHHSALDFTSAVCNNS